MIRDREAIDAFLAQVRRLVREVMVPREAEVAEADAIPTDIVALMRGLGLFGMSIPEAHGGLGMTMEEEALVAMELGGASPAFRSMIGTNNGIGSQGIVMDGTEAQKARWLPRLASGEVVGSFALTEPDAGSDAGSLRTTARRDGDHYVINGQKTWSTRAVWADWCFGMFRTDPASERHHGLSFILVPMKTPGITVRPIPQLDGLPGFAEIFFDEVRVPADCLLGDEGKGWKVAMATAGFERGLMLRSPARFQQTAARLVELYKANRESADRDPTVRDAVIRAWMDAEAYCLTTYQTACRLLNGGKIADEASTNKIFWSELDQRMHETALSILGARAELWPHAPDAGEVGNWLDGFLFSQSGSIYAGTNEIQRNIIAQRMLGMPRA